MMAGVSVFSSVVPTPLVGLGDDGVVVFATLFGFARVAELGVNGAGVISAGAAAAVLSKQA